MSQHAVTATPDAPADAAPVQRRPALRTLRAILRNPLHSWPAEIDTKAVVRTRLLGRDTVFVTAPELIGQVLTEQSELFRKADTMTRALRPALGDGLLTAEGAHWRWQRRAVAPGFRPDRIDGFLPAMLAAARTTRDRWLALADNTTIELGHEMMRTTFDIIVNTMLSGGGGIDPARVERGMSDYLGATGWAIALTMVGAPAWTPYPGRLRAARASAYLRREMLRLIGERRVEAPAPDATDRPDRPRDLIALLLEAHDGETGRAMDDDEVADNLLTFIAAGHETTALALAWALRLLAEHPAIEARVLAEIAAVTGGRGVAPADVGRLPYTRQVIQEAMRLYPPAAILVRKAVQDLTLGGVPVAAGSSVYIPVYALHRRASLWPEPERFDPDRFAPAASKARHRYAYLPFGGGPRVCIGGGFALLEAVAILATLLPAVRLVCPEGSVRPQPVLRITLRPEGGLSMQAYRRQ